MKLEPTQVQFEFEEVGGYRFKVTATRVFDPSWGDRGWSGEVVMKSTGLVSAEAAVAHLRHSAKAFLRQTEGLAE